MSDMVSIVVPLGAALIAAAAALGGTWSGGRNEKTKWLREERAAAWTRVLDEATAMIVAVEGGKAAVDASALRSAANRARILGPASAAKACADAYHAAVELAYKINAPEGDVSLAERDEAYLAWGEAEDRLGHEARRVL